MTLDETLCFAINHLGSGGHPAATPENIDTFGAEYIKDCVERARQRENQRERRCTA
jgi:hypothetical protein